MAYQSFVTVEWFSRECKALTYQGETSCQHRVECRGREETPQKPSVWGAQGRRGQQSAKTGTAPHRAQPANQREHLRHQRSLHREQTLHWPEREREGGRERERDVSLLFLLLKAFANSKHLTPTILTYNIATHSTDEIDQSDPQPPNCPLNLYSDVELYGDDDDDVNDTEVDERWREPAPELLSCWSCRVTILVPDAHTVEATDAAKTVDLKAVSGQG